MQALEELKKALRHLMRATEALATKWRVNKKAVSLSVAAENDVRRLLELVARDEEENEPCKP